ADAKQATGTACTDDGNPCTTDACDGTSVTCQHTAGNPGALCRAAANECDLPESCTGSSPSCPTDLVKAAGTACADDGNPCTTDACDGTSVTCQHAAGNSGALCRAAVNECDLPETCTGTTPSCPTDLVKAAGTACTDDGNFCTTDVCNGTAGVPACVHDPGNAGTVCRAAAGACDVAEACTGSSSVCPIDEFKSVATECRPAAGECDIAETCTGTTPTCPADTFKPPSVECR